MSDGAFTQCAIAPFSSCTPVLSFITRDGSLLPFVTVPPSRVPSLVFNGTLLDVRDGTSLLARDGALLVHWHSFTVRGSLLRCARHHLSTSSAFRWISFGASPIRDSVDLLACDGTLSFRAQQPPFLVRKALWILLSAQGTSFLVHDGTLLPCA